MKHWIRSLSHYEPSLLQEQFNFGHKELLFYIYGIDQEKYLRAKLQHGWIYNNLRNFRDYQKDKFGRFYPRLVWGKRSLMALRRFSQIETIPIGAPGLHLAAFLQERNLEAKYSSSKEQNKVLYFPSHSFHGAEVVRDFASLDKLKDLGNVTVCLYWLDYLDPKLRERYEGSGCQVTSAGYRGASSYEIPWSNIGGRATFLVNLFKLIQSSSIVAVDDVSTAFWYGIFLGKRCIVNRRVSQWEISSVSRREARHFETHDNAEILRELLHVSISNEELILPQGLALEVAKSELGFEYLDNFAAFVEENNSLGKFRRGCVNSVKINNMFEEALSEWV